MKPQLPIEVDQATGVWTSDGLPMLYVPRHFFTNNHITVEAALGRERYAQILYPAGYRSAYFWCEQESRQHGLKGLDVFAHYLKRLSQRGWGLFGFGCADASATRATIKLRHSSFVLQQPEARGKLCYMFEAWFSGAMDWVNDQDQGEGEGRPLRAVCREIQCAADGHDHCVFAVTPLDASLVKT